ncbi:hypothetical protein EDD11_008662 [Mortierella claussenii]|nr:hypothetical protein EDD11_008662 [Mortierella claussenii]
MLALSLGRASYLLAAFLVSSTTLVSISEAKPDTPPDSQPSDIYAQYKYEQTLTLNDFKPTPDRRTIVIGDIHGSLEGFNTFLSKNNFNANKDTLIFAGDLVTKGPTKDSLAVLDKARQLKALCVRGNHDDVVIRWKGFLDSGKTSVPDDLEKGDDHYDVAKNLTPEQYQYLLSCPLVLTLPAELSYRKTTVRVVHAGVDPAKDIMQQLPWVLTNVRTIGDDGTPSRKNKGSSWATEFNDKKNGYMLIYGHDASRGLNVKDLTVGLDSGCVYGRSLSGYVVETGKILSSSCPQLVSGDD